VVNVDTNKLYDGDTVWVGGYTGFDESDLIGFKSYDDALQYSLKYASIGRPARVEESLRTEGRYCHGHDAQNYVDILLIQVTLPNGNERLVLKK